MGRPGVEVNHNGNVMTRIAGEKPGRRENADAWVPRRQAWSSWVRLCDSNKPEDADDTWVVRLPDSDHEINCVLAKWSTKSLENEKETKKKKSKKTGSCAAVQGCCAACGDFI